MRLLAINFALSDTSISACLEIARLRWRDRRELAAVRLQIDQRRAIETVEAAHQNDVAFDADEFCDRRAERIGAHRGSQGKRAMGVGVAGGTLQDQIAARLMQPVDHFDLRKLVESLERGHPRFENLDPAHWPVMTALPRSLQPVGPGRMDATDEDKSCVGW